MGKIVIFAEKPDIGTRLAATIGGCFINGVELKPEMISNKKYEKEIKSERFRNGFLKAQLNGKECVITWGFGHIAELKQAADYDPKYKKWAADLFPFVPSEFEIKLKEDANVGKHFALIKSLFCDKNTDFIINATDADREGELIFDYCYRLTGTAVPFKRLWINSYTEEAVEKGFNSLMTEKQIAPLQHAGRCRAIADWLVGSNLTVLATLKYGGYKNMISLGRVQTPTLAILVNRELEIQEFKPEKYFELVGTFKTSGADLYRGKWKRGKTERFQTKADAEKLLATLNGVQGVVSRYDEARSEEKPPLLYDLTSLQGEANGKYAFSAQQTLEIVQKLYENQVLTYPRTNSRFLSEDLKQEMKRILAALPDEYNPHRDALANGKLAFTKRVFDNSKVESHHAIIPTYKTPSGLSSDEQKIYDLVAKSLIKAFMPNAIWSNTKVETTVGKEAFYSSGKTLVDAGWRAVDGTVPKSEDDSEQLLPLMTKGEAVSAEKYDILAKQTKAPSRYTEKTLLSTMETAGKFVEDDELREAMKDHGLGTPATRAATIERLVRVGYIRREKKNLVPTEKGIDIIKVFPIEEVKSPTLTGDWEFKLNQIERGKVDPEAFIQEISEFVIGTATLLKGEQSRQIGELEDSLGKCPKCGSSVLKNKRGHGCSNWKNGCKFQLWDSPICGKKLTAANVKQILQKGETAVIKGFVGKSGKEFDAKLALIKDSDGKLEFKFEKR